MTLKKKEIRICGELASCEEGAQSVHHLRNPASGTPFSERPGPLGEPNTLLVAPDRDNRAEHQKRTAGPHIEAQRLVR